MPSWSVECTGACSTSGRPGRQIHRNVAQSLPVAVTAPTAEGVRDRSVGGHPMVLCEALPAAFSRRHVAPNFELWQTHGPHSLLAHGHCQLRWV